MYSVLIVEDEILVRLGLKNSIDWNKFDMTVIADVPDGQTALDIYEKEKPDLIITDLKMPIMGGMELINRIREKDKKTRIIILSCLEEFELAKKAISLGVSDYILKLTMSEEEIEAVLKRAQNELSKQGITSFNRPLGKSNTDIVKEKFLKDFLFYNFYSVKEFEAYIEEFKLRLNPARLIMCIMEIDNFGLLQTRFKDEKGQLIKLSMINIMDEILGNYRRGEVIYDTDIHYILIFSFDDVISEQVLQQELFIILNNIKSVVSTFFSISVSFGISGIQNGYASLGKMYDEALRAIEQKFFLGNGLFLFLNSKEIEHKTPEKIETLRYLPKLSKLMDDSAIKDYNVRIDLMINIFPKTKKQIQESFYRLLQWIASSLHLKDDKSAAVVISYSHKIQQCDTLDEIIEIFKCFVFEITEHAMKKKVLSREISEALQFIQTNYSKDISLYQVAEYAGLSTSYFSNLFKKESKVNFKEYLNELRVEKAKELLLGTYLKSYEIAENVGFAENTYFSKVFKRLTGTSPNEFRKQWMKEWTEDMDNEDI